VTQQRMAMVVLETALLVVKIAVKVGLEPETKYLKQLLAHWGIKNL
jgi:hypothetical protein